MKRFLCILTILICVFAYSEVLSASTPPSYPDDGPVDNAKDHYFAWWRTIDQVETNVRTKFNAAMGIVNDLRSADASIRNTMYASLPAGLKKSVTSALGSALGISVRLATDMAKAMTLEAAALKVFGEHTKQFDTFNDYWDGSGWATQSNVLAKMQTEVNQNGVPGVEANSLMEAFHRYEYAMGVYNLQVQKWNAYAPSQAVTELTLSDPVKPGFKTISCFNKCGDFFDTFSDAESSHKEKCGTGDNIDLFDTNRPAAEYSAYLGSRSVAQGCGRDYYDCPKKPAGTEHKKQTCTIWVWEKPSGYLNAFKSYQCGRQFRECMWWLTRDHNPHDLNPFEATHSASGDSSTDNPPSDDADETTQNEFQQPPTPAPSTPSYHACGVHEDWQSGDHSAASCGHASHYVCDGLTHQQVQCSSTNANGDQCTYSYWQCLYSSTPSHTDVYPALPAPEPDPEPEDPTCANGHSYDPNNPLEANAHRTRTCRYSRCGNSWPECSNNPLCNDPRRKALGKYCWPE